MPVSINSFRFHVEASLVALASVLVLACDKPKPPPPTDHTCTEHLDLSSNAASQRAFLPEDRHSVQPILLLARQQGLDGASPILFDFDWQDTNRLSLEMHDLGATEEQGVALFTPGWPGTQTLTVTVQGKDADDHVPRVDVGWMTLSVPQLVVIDKDDDFEAMLTAQYYLVDLVSFYAEARAAFTSFMRDANVRFVWRAHYNEEIPPQYLDGGFAEQAYIRVVLHGSPDHCGGDGDLGSANQPEGKNLIQGDVHVCPSELPAGFKELRGIIPQRHKFGLEQYNIALARLTMREAAHETYHMIFGRTARGLDDSGHAPAPPPKNLGGVLVEALKIPMYDATAIRYERDDNGTILSAAVVEEMDKLLPLSGILQETVSGLLPIPPALADYEDCTTGHPCDDRPCDPMRLRCFAPTQQWSGGCFLEYCDDCCCIGVANCTPEGGCKSERGDKEELDLTLCPDLYDAMHAYQTIEAITEQYVNLWPGRACGIVGIDGDTCSHICPINLCATCD